MSAGLPREGQEFAGRYRLLRKLGEGGFGTVFEAEHLRIPGRRLALKVLNPLFTADPKLRDRFLREVEAASRLTHQHVIVMREVDATPEGLYYCTMDISPGRSLRQILNREGKLDPARACRLAAQVLDALNHAHERGVVHRDMKPENVLVEVDPSGREVAKVLDFGLAKLLDGDAAGAASQFTTPGSVVGTLQYIAPEQAEALGDVDGRADQYTVAVMLFGSLTGRLPFDATSAMGFAIAHMTRPPPKLRDFAVFDAIPDALEDAVARALAKRPEQRFFEAREFGEALLAATADSRGTDGRAILTPAANEPWPPAPGAPAPPERTLPRSNVVPASAAASAHSREQAALKTISEAPRGGGGPQPARPAPEPPPPPRGVSQAGLRTTDEPYGGSHAGRRTADVPHGPSQAGLRTADVPPRGVSQAGQRTYDAQPVPPVSSTAHAPVPPPAPGPVLALKPGALLGRYRIEKEIGGGGMGKVYRARHVHMNRVAAVKVLLPDLASDPAIRARFLREARIASVLKHPAVVELYDFEEVGALCWLAMELVLGRPLNEIVSEQPEKRLSPARVARIFDQMLDALAAAHQAGIVHRDLKPSNIMIGAHDEVTVLDFGIARILEPAGTSSPEAQLTQLGEFLGTPAYAAPEQIQGRPVDGRTDLYTATVILFQLLSGRRPFESPTAKGYLVKHVIETPPLLSSLRPDLPRVGELDVILARGLAKDADLRFQTALEMRAALLGVLPPPAPPVPGAPSGQFYVASGAGLPVAGFSGAFPARRGAPASPAAPPTIPQTYAEPQQSQPQQPLARAPVSGPYPAQPPGSGRVAEAPPSGPMVGMSAMPTSFPTSAAGAAGTRAYVAVRGARSLSKLFLIGGSKLAFGRSREDEKRGVRNHIVLRVLPCRDQAQDPANWAATMRLSNAHGELGIAGGHATILDRSSRGITLQGAPLAKEVPTPLSDLFELDIGGGALRLHGRVARGGAGGRGAPVDAVVVRRGGNAEGHVYALVAASVTIGSDPACALSLDAPGLAPVHAVIEHAPGGFRIISTAGPGDAPVEVDGIPLAPGAGTPLAIGRRIRLGGLEMEPREMVETEFTTP